jgi:hypothetical protein
LEVVIISTLFFLFRFGPLSLSLKFEEDRFVVADIFHITNVYGVTAGWVGRSVAQAMLPRCAGYVNLLCRLCYCVVQAMVPGCAGYVVGWVGNYSDNNATFVAHLAS